MKNRTFRRNEYRSNRPRRGRTPRGHVEVDTCTTPPTGYRMNAHDNISRPLVTIQSYQHSSGINATHNQHPRFFSSRPRSFSCATLSRITYPGLSATPNTHVCTSVKIILPKSHGASAKTAGSSTPRSPSHPADNRKHDPVG